MMRGYIVAAYLLLTFSTAARANGSLCTSPEFHAAFTAGQVSIDYPSMSAKLIGYGDAALPCLKRIVAGQGAKLGISQCRQEPERCRVWAMTAVGRIGTPAARAYLKEYLDTGTDRRLIVGAINAVGNLRASELAPTVRRMLKHGDAEVRARAVLSLGIIGTPDDFDALLATTLGLPSEHLYTGAQGLVKLGDERAIRPLEEHAAGLTDETARIALQSAISQLRTKTRSSP